jgi:hypothetical protein
MFEIAEKVFIDLHKLALVHVYQSLNQPQVSPGQGLVSQSAQATILVLRNSPTIIEIFVGLFFPDSNNRILYKSGPFQAEIVEEKIAEAEGFVGEMGFLMDNLHYSSSSQPERNEILRRIPFFYKEMDLYFQALSSSEIEVRKTKIEAVAQRDAQIDNHRLFLEKYVQIVSML